MRPAVTFSSAPASLLHRPSLEGSFPHLIMHTWIYLCPSAPAIASAYRFWVRVPHPQVFAQFPPNFPPRSILIRISRVRPTEAALLSLTHCYLFSSWERSAAGRWSPCPRAPHPTFCFRDMSFDTSLSWPCSGYSRVPFSLFPL